MKLQIWQPTQAKKELAARLSYAKESRKRFENDWQNAENALFNTSSTKNEGLNVNVDGGSVLGITDIDQSASDYKTNYTYKNYRYICSQFAANPPSVIPRPTSPDFSDKQKADMADRLVRYSRTTYELGPRFEELANHAMAYGTGIMKTVWDPEAGEPIEFDQATGELTMTGDICVEAHTPWDIYIDPDAVTENKIKWIFQRILMPFEEALSRFPDREDDLKRYRKKKESSQGGGSQSLITRDSYDTIEIYQYWEKGLGVNGFVGRFCWCLDDGTLLSPVEPNPFRFAPPTDKGLAMPEEGEPKEGLATAYLPYRLFTDGDIPNTPYGKSTVLYGSPLQDLHNKLLNTIIDAVQAHGVPRMVLPEGSEVAENSITNSPWDIIRLTGNQAPHFMEPMPLPAAVTQLLEISKVGIDDMFGVNESMFGQQSREQSGFSMQYATSQGNLIRQRTFNKYRIVIEGVYRDILNLMRKEWTDERTIVVLGKEKAFEAVKLKGTDLDGGFDITCEYGASLSIDPTARREEIITLMPILEGAGIDKRTILSMLKLNDLESAYDMVTMAADRQREIFTEMTNTGEYIMPRELEDHPNYLKFAYAYRQSAEFKWLNSTSQSLIEKHMKERELLASQVPAAAAQPTGVAPNPLPPTSPSLGSPAAEPGVPGTAPTAGI